MSDDEPSRAEQRLIDHARKQQAKQPQPSGKVTVKRTTRFHGDEPRNAYWLSQAWSPDGTQLAYGGKTAKNAGSLTCGTATRVTTSRSACGTSRMTSRAW